MKASLIVTLACMLALSGMVRAEDIADNAEQTDKEKTVSEESAPVLQETADTIDATDKVTTDTVEPLADESGILVEPPKKAVIVASKEVKPVIRKIVIKPRFDATTPMANEPRAPRK